MLKFKMSCTLEEFKAGIARHAALLNRHGLKDPAERSKGWSNRSVVGHRGRLPIREIIVEEPVQAELSAIEESDD